MKRIRLNKMNAIYTRGSRTTLLINYSDKQHILEVVYTGGKVYQYRNVEPRVWEEYKQTVLSGGSSGIFVNSRIKPNYPDYDEV
jgi:hypothetical protein